MAERRTPTRRSRPEPEPEEQEEERQTFPPPPWLDGDAAAIWTEIIDQHHEPERLNLTGLAAYCGQVALERDARKRVAQEGMIVADERGRPEPHPAIAVQLKAQAEIRAWGDAFLGRPNRKQPRRTR